MNSFAIEKNCSCHAVIDTSLGMDRILCFREARLRESYFQYYAIIGKWYNFSGPQFPHLEIRNNNTCLIGR